MAKTLKIILLVLIGLIVLFDLVLFVAVGKEIDNLPGSLFPTPSFAFGKFLRISGMGRLVIVKVDRYVPDFVYKVLEFKLKIMDVFSSEINDVYLNQGGTITVDCR